MLANCFLRVLPYLKSPKSLNRQEENYFFILSTKYLVLFKKKIIRMNELCQD